MIFNYFHYLYPQKYCINDSPQKIVDFLSRGELVVLVQRLEGVRGDLQVVGRILCSTKYIKSKKQYVFINVKNKEKRSCNYVYYLFSFMREASSNNLSVRSSDLTISSFSAYSSSEH